MLWLEIIIATVFLVMKGFGIHVQSGVLFYLVVPISVFALGAFYSKWDKVFWALDTEQWFLNISATLLTVFIIFFSVYRTNFPFGLFGEEPFWPLVLFPVILAILVLVITLRSERWDGIIEYKSYIGKMIFVIILVGLHIVLTERRLLITLFYIPIVLATAFKFIEANKDLFQKIWKKL